jgi:hypothetical protein
MRPQINKNSNQEPNLEPQLVKNPFTEKFVNVAPLWMTLNEHYQNDFDCLRERLEYIIKTLSLTSIDGLEPNEEKDMLFDLYVLKELVENFSVYKNSCGERK